MGANPNNPSYVSLIIAGGSGTRFWPASTKALPKQYLNLSGKNSLIQDTVERLLPLGNHESIYICSGESQKKLLNEQLPKIQNLILEPMARNTAPCLMLSIRDLIKKGMPLDTVLGVFPADHVIQHPEQFQNVLRKAIDYASQNDALMTLGITPTSPHTGYGYIQSSKPTKNEIVPAVRFVEKPNLEKAKEFISAGNFYWNCGIFIWSLKSIVKAFELYLAEDWNKLLNAKDSDIPTVFSSLKSQPIDTAIMEKSKNVFVLGAESLGWSDVGSWNALYELKRDGKENVVISGKVESVESSGCLVNVPQEKLVAIIGVDDLVVVESNGKILIMKRDKDQLVKTVAEKNP